VLLSGLLRDYWLKKASKPDAARPPRTTRRWQPPGKAGRSVCAHK
jgi:hypothetical protein